MRAKRIKYERPCFYHLVCRIVGRAFLLTRKEKRIFLQILKKTARFSGIDILTFSIMSNHIHVLVMAPGFCDASEEELLRRIGELYNEDVVNEKRAQWERWKREGLVSLLNQDIQELRARMGDISKFMKLFKQLCTKSYNKRNNRTGTIWEGRFWSGIVQREFLPIVGAYIDLNAVRAGIVTRPEHYRWCGFSEAFYDTDPYAREGLATIFSSHLDVTDWNTLLEQYGKFLYFKDALPDKPFEGFNPDHVATTLASGGTVSECEILHCRVRYFTAVPAIGDRDFIEEVFQDFRRNFGPNRKTGARLFRGCKEWLGKLFVLRDLKKDLFTPMKI